MIFGQRVAVLRHTSPDLLIALQGDWVGGLSRSELYATFAPEGPVPGLRNWGRDKRQDSMSIGLDVHKATMAWAVAQGVRSGKRDGPEFSSSLTLSYATVLVSFQAASCPRAAPLPFQGTKATAAITVPGSR